jgi:hypothetical protein
MMNAELNMEVAIFIGKSHLKIGKQERKLSHE